jgi:hypothetical protein
MAFINGSRSLGIAWPSHTPRGRHGTTPYGQVAAHTTAFMAAARAMIIDCQAGHGAGQADVTTHQHRAVGVARSPARAIRIAGDGRRIFNARHTGRHS